MKVENKKLDDGSLQLVLSFEPYEVKCLEHDLIDIVEWYSKGPVSEKIHSCQKRMIKDSMEMLMESNEMRSMSVGQMNDLMKDNIKVCQMISQLPEYKNRKARENLK